MSPVVSRRRSAEVWYPGRLWGHDRMEQPLPSPPRGQIGLDESGLLEGQLGDLHARGVPTGQVGAQQAPPPSLCTISIARSIASRWLPGTALDRWWSSLTAA